MPSGNECEGTRASICDADPVAFGGFGVHAWSPAPPLPIVASAARRIRPITVGSAPFDTVAASR